MQTRKGRPGRRPALRSEERLVGRNVTLHPQQIQWLEREADRRNVTVSQVLRELIDRGIGGLEAVPQESPTAGAELVAELEANGFIGAWEDRSDIGDSVEFARRVRERAQTRADRFDAEEIQRLGGAHPAGPAGR
jgi:hypothetical protein